mmetsp:Transcript_7405/g.15873  ORF Transcript_7405/g.15873 Transcript_7405/m.15873 type:complete len:201 (+) Transcript_7405:48-650(+)
MGIDQSNRNKRRKTGGRRNVHIMKRKYNLGRPAANTKIGAKRVRPVRVRFGNTKWRALRLDHGNFAWPTEKRAFKTKIISAVYNASNNEFVRTNTLTKGAVVLVDAAPFRLFYWKYYGLELGRKKEDSDMSKRSPHARKRCEARAKDAKIEPALKEQFLTGRLLACVASRPGQCGVADGYILEGDELAFYKKKMEKKKKA